MEEKNLRFSFITNPPIFILFINPQTNDGDVSPTHPLELWFWSSYHPHMNDDDGRPTYLCLNDDFDPPTPEWRLWPAHPPTHQLRFWSSHTSMTIMVRPPTYTWTVILNPSQSYTNDEFRPPSTYLWYISPFDFVPHTNDDDSPPSHPWWPS